MASRARHHRTVGRLILATSLACLIGGCSDSSEPPLGDETPPDANLILAISMSQHREFPTEAAFVLSAGTSTDDQSPRDSLQARWDYNGDGTWDTAFGSDLIVAIVPDPLLVDDWSARCEIRDEAGNRAIDEQTEPLPDWLAIPPDIIAGDIGVSVAGTAVDTVAVNQPFGVFLSQLGWLDGPMPSVQVDVLIDGDLIRSTNGQPNPPYCDVCSYFGWAGYTIATPGTHEIVCVTDAAGEIDETNEDNNRSTRTLVVIEQPTP